MKKILALIIALAIMALSFVCFTACGDDVNDKITGDNEEETGGKKDGKSEFTYVTNPDDSVSITGYTSGTYQFHVVEIPEKIDGRDVTGIGEKAFYHDSSITGIIFPSKLEKIDAWAFAGCSYIESITLPDSVKTIGEGAFYSCVSLKSITFGSGLEKIGDSAFWACAAIETLNFPSTLKEIGAYAFWNCTAVKQVIIPNSVAKIGEMAFYECSALVSAIVYPGTTEIGMYAFNKCADTFKISVSEGSYAEQYAKDSYLDFDYLEKN